MTAPHGASIVWTIGILGTAWTASTGAEPQIVLWVGAHALITGGVILLFW